MMEIGFFNKFMREGELTTKFPGWGCGQPRILCVDVCVHT